MSLELYSTINFFAIIIAVVGLILPALIIYTYSRYKNYLLLILGAAMLFLPVLVIGDYIITLAPLILSIIFSSIMGMVLRRHGEDFWHSLSYIVLAQMAGILFGVVIIYFYYGMQDIAGLLSEGFRSAYESVPETDEISSWALGYMVQIMLFAQEGVMPEAAEISAMTITQKLDIIVPLVKEGLANSLPSVIMGYGIVSGVWTWFISTVMIKNSYKQKKEMAGIKEYKPYPPFSEWKLPRWFTNVLMLVLLAAIIFTFAGDGSMLNLATALQSVVIVIFAIQGLSVVNWWLKKKNVNIVLNVLICVLGTVFLSFALPWIGIFDIVFSVRMSDQQKQAIIKKMEEIKKQVDEQMQEMEDYRQNEETDDKSEEDKIEEDTDNSKENESEDEK